MEISTYKPVEVATKTNKPGLENRWGPIVGHIFRNFIAPFHFNANPRLSSGGVSRPGPKWVPMFACLAIHVVAEFL